MEITAADVGRKVRLRNGETTTLTYCFTGTTYPFGDSYGDRWDEEGRCGATGGSSDIIGFVDEEETIDDQVLETVEKDVARIVKLENGELAVVMTVKDFLDFTSREE